jgi:hypothetical protein
MPAWAGPSGKGQIDLTRLHVKDRIGPAGFNDLKLHAQCVGHILAHFDDKAAPLARARVFGEIGVFVQDASDAQSPPRRCR